tara:strand:- start:130 stop:270 length:141 start_codon:yes stop_codon:yes gene_type:complete
MIKFITENKNNELSNKKIKEKDIKNENHQNNIDIIKNYKSGFLFLE